jgi:hypothetical protein
MLDSDFGLSSMRSSKAAAQVYVKCTSEDKKRCGCVFASSSKSSSELEAQ